MKEAKGIRGRLARQLRGVGGPQYARKNLGQEAVYSFLLRFGVAYSMRAGDLNNNGKLALAMETYPPEDPPTTVNVVFHR
jgi:hypothetical protein